MGNFTNKTIDQLTSQVKNCTSALTPLEKVYGLMEENLANWHQWKEPYLEQYNWLKSRGILPENMMRDNKFKQLAEGLGKLEVEQQGINNQAKALFQQARTALNALEHDLIAFKSFIDRKTKSSMWKGKKSLPTANSTYTKYMGFLERSEEDFAQWRDLFAY